MGSGLYGKMTVDDMIEWCEVRFKSGQFSDPYVMVPGDGLLALIYYIKIQKESKVPFELGPNFIGDVDVIQ